ncbi:hypothetical protein BG000_002391 [Podila horticola]|nr:hypothetical protein BG000_002391 [Podila horticola]
MVKIFSAVAVSLALVLAAAPTAPGEFILSSGALTSSLISTKVKNCQQFLGYTTTGNTLKKGDVFCSYLAAVDMSICQCHDYNISAKEQNDFLVDITGHLNFLGICNSSTNNTKWSNGWINGFYRGSPKKQSANIVRGKVSSAQFVLVTCSIASEGKSWRHLTSGPRPPAKHRTEEN